MRCILLPMYVRLELAPSPKHRATYSKRPTRQFQTHHPQAPPHSEGMSCTKRQQVKHSKRRERDAAKLCHRLGVHDVMMLKLCSGMSYETVTFTHSQLQRVHKDSHQPAPSLHHSLAPLLTRYQASRGIAGVLTGPSYLLVTLFL